MSDDVPNLILARLDLLRGEIADMRREARDTRRELLLRLSGVEERLRLLQGGKLQDEADMARVQSLVEQLRDQVDRINARLGLVGE